MNREMFLNQLVDLVVKIRNDKLYNTINKLIKEENFDQLDWFICGAILMAPDSDRNYNLLVSIRNLLNERIKQY